MERVLYCLIALIYFMPGYSQHALWEPITEERAGGDRLERSSVPSGYLLYRLNAAAMDSMLEQVPLRDVGTVSSVIIPFPDGEGKMAHYRVYEAPVLHPSLGERYPGIKSYAGQGVEDPSASIRFSTTLYGLHAMTFSARGTSYIDPYTKNSASYIVYKKSGLTTARTFSCGVTGGTDDTIPEENHTQPFSAQASDGILRKYRLALACTVEYAAYHISAAGLSPQAPAAQKTAAVLAAMNVTMTRVNGIYERDLSLTMQIVPNNDDIIFLFSDNLSNNNETEMLNQITPIINNEVGFANYDIGHVMGTGNGGIASLGTVCTPGKARGVTGNAAPLGDPFDIDYVAHEMGHQFGATHTFNNSVQRTPFTAVEPGSGSTIMSYAGISVPNVQSNSDAYFHAVSLAQISGFIAATATCAETPANGNTAPVIAPLQSYTIPKSTAFVLRGSAADSDGDVLTYCWEQVNANGAAATINQPPNPASTSGPNFRSLPPSAAPDRFMPNLQSVLDGNLTPVWEVAPAVGRTLNFALTVRDNRAPGGGQTARRDRAVTVSNEAGPFTVTSQNTEGISWLQGTSEAITWNVAGTTANGINTSHVNILLSTDGGQTFTTVLAANTPNDGFETVTVPAVAAPFCRLMVQAADNIYYAVNTTPFAVGYIVDTVCTTYTNDTATPIPDGAATFSESVINVPDNAVISAVSVSVNISHPFIGNLFLNAISPAGTRITLWEGACDNSSNLNIVFSDSGQTTVCGSPTTGTFIPATPLSALEGESSEGNWVLEFIDPFAGNAGTLDSWSVEVCTQTITLNTDAFRIKDFTLYPNPNSGSFTVVFSPELDNEVRIAIHDMRGREVFENYYEPTANFSAAVNSGTLEAGVYLVTVTQGNNRTVKKIMVR